MNTAPLEGFCILVVEDDYLIAQDVSGSLKRAGATVLGPVPSVDKAKRLLAAEAPDAAVLDVNLGQENSFPVAQDLTDRNIPFLFSTGYNSGDIPAEWAHVTVAMKPLRLAAVTALLGAD